jgi:pimeloyl-ACP methyl ester carboxylesterase
MERTPFTASTETGPLSGWVAGSGPRVLALHGGPGMSYNYLDEAVLELASGYEVATFQQRGQAPSTEAGAFTIDEAVADVGAVLDGLGWVSAYVMGHSYGGHLVFPLALDLPDRLLGVLSVDPLGAVGDGGAEAFGAEMQARVPEDKRARMDALLEKDAADGLDPEESREFLELCWPSYFADPANAPTPPALTVAGTAYQGLWADLMERMPALEQALPTISVPVGVLAGERSPIPTTAGTDTAERIPGAWSSVVPGAGHFLWYEAPGSLVAAMDRLVAHAEART